MTSSVPWKLIKTVRVLQVYKILTNLNNLNHLLDLYLFMLESYIILKASILRVSVVHKLFSLM